MLLIFKIRKCRLRFYDRSHTQNGLNNTLRTVKCVYIGYTMLPVPTFILLLTQSSKTLLFP